MLNSLRRVWGYFGLFFMLGAVIASLGPTLPNLASNVGATIGQIGILFSARSFGYLVGSFTSGSFFDRWRGHTLMGILTLTAAVAMATIPNIHWLLLLGIVIFVVGFAQGGVDVGSNTLLVWTASDRAGALLNAMYFFAGLGSFLAPLYLQRVDLIWGYRGIAIGLLPLALWLFLTPSPAIPQRIQQKQTTITDVDFFVGFAVLAFLYIGVEVSYGGWIFTYLLRSGLGDEATAYKITSLFWLAVMFGRLISIGLASRFQAKHLIMIYLGGAVFSAAWLRFAAHAPMIIWLGTLGMGWSLAALFPTTYAFVQQHVPITGRINGFVWAAGSLGAMILPWFIGQQMETSGPLSMMGIIFFVWVAALMVFLWMVWRAMQIKGGHSTLISNTNRKRTL